MGWYGSWDINYNGTNNEKFVKLSKLLIPNYIERFKENKENNRLECTRNLSWYSADVDIAKIMEYLDDNDSLDVTIYGETKPYIIDEDGEEQELECEEETFRKEDGKVVLDNPNPDEDRYTDDELGIYDYLADLEDIEVYIPFITREIGPDDEIMPIAQSVLHDAFSRLEDASFQPLASKATEMKEKFANIESTKSFFKEMYEQQKDLIEQQKTQQEQNEMEGIPSFLANMNQNDIRHLGGMKQLTMLVAKLGEDKARETLQILGYDVGPSKLSDKKVEPEAVIKQAISFETMRTPSNETIKKEQESTSKLYEETTQKSEECTLTVDDLKSMYTYVFDRDGGIVTARKVEKRQVPYTLHLPDGTTVQKIREENGKVSDHLFFKDKNGIVTLIPELSYQEEGDINGNHYRSSDSSTYGSTRHGSHTFDVHEWGFEGHDEEGKQIGRFDKHYRYVTLDDSQKLVKVFESEHYIDKPWGDLYHRNKDENGKQCIRLVDLAGNIHSIKEGGKVGEKGLKEKTFGPRGDYQLKVVYKDNEPVYALFMGSYGDEPNEFCTAEELRQCYERETGSLRGYGISYGDDEDCFSHMEEVIENFNESFMKGNFVPLLDKTKKTKQDKTVTELAADLKTLEQQEEKAKQLLSEYQQMPKANDREF